MAFRYINPGYAALLDNDCVTEQVTGAPYSKTGVAFSQTKKNAGVTLLSFAEGDELWARFDAYITPAGSSSELYFTSPNGSHGFFLSIPSSVTSTSHSLLWRIFSGSNNLILESGTAEKMGIKRGGINKFWCHIKFGSASDSLIEVLLNDRYFNGTGYAMNYVANYTKIATLYDTNIVTKFSNVIFSNEEISPKERVISLPTGATFTDMVAGASGLYIADAANQTLLQSVDVATLIENFGASSAVTGVVVAGIPAYKTAEGLATLISLSKSGGSVIEHGNFPLSSDSAAVVTDGWGLSGVTIADLQNMQFGWKVGE